MDRDPVVARALRTLNPPEPGPAFWVEVEQALGVTRRRARRTMPWWAAAAAAVVLLAASLVVGNQLGSDGRDLPRLTPPTSEVAKRAGAAKVVIDFVNALGAGDTAAARRLLGPRSEAVADAFLGPAASEGFGAWSASPDRSTRTIALPDGGTVVVLVGTVQQEGETNFRTDAFPVVRAESAAAWFVEPWAYGDGGVDSQITRDGDQAYLPANADAAYLSVDGEPAMPVTIPDDGIVLLDLAMEGTHLFTLVATGADGLFVATAVRNVFP